MRRLMSTYLSICTAVLGMLGSLIVLFYNENMETKSFWYPFDKTPIIWIPVLLLMLVVLIMLLIITLEIVLKRIKQHKREQLGIDIDERDK